MTNREPSETANLDIYGSDALPWSRARDALARAHGPGSPFFLGTVRPDGRPHAAAFGPAWLDGTVFFTSGPGTRKSRNLQANPACTISASLEGIDLVLEGEAVRETDPATVAAVVAIYNDGGWPAQAEGDVITAPYSAPSAGPAPWHLYRFTFHTIFGVATAEPFGASRWRF